MIVKVLFVFFKVEMQIAFLMVRWCIWLDFCSNCINMEVLFNPK